jgi:hypothetical protein
MSEPAPIFEITHDPQALLDYGFDWVSRGWLAESPGDTVDASEWELAAETDVEDDAAEVFDQDLVDGVATAWLRNLTDDVDYLLTNTVTLTPSGRVDSRTMRIRCRNR